MGESGKEVKIQYYVLFPNHEAGIKLYRLLKAQGIRTQISPTPRAASKCCGISLLVLDVLLLDDRRKSIEENAIEIIDIVALEVDINRTRDRYC